MYSSVDALFQAYENGERPRLEFTHHALRRGVEMADQLGLDPAEISRAMTAPERYYLSNTYEGLNLIRGRVCLGVIVDEGGLPRVTTVLWSKIRDWKRSYKNDHGIEGRQRRFGAET